MFSEDHLRFFVHADGSRRGRVFLPPFDWVWRFSARHIKNRCS